MNEYHPIVVRAFEPIRDVDYDALFIALVRDGSIWPIGGVQETMDLVSELNEALFKVQNYAMSKEGKL